MDEDKANVFRRKNLLKATCLTDADKMRCRFWWDETLTASFFFQLPAVGAADAAKLLSRFDPRESPVDWLDQTTDQTTPQDHWILWKGFEAHDKKMPLLDWLELAKCQGWKHHTWIDEYISASGGEAELRHRARDGLPTPQTMADPKENQRESPAARAKRRLDWLRTNGGDYVNRGGSWLSSGQRGLLQKLANLEKEAGAAMSDRSDVRKDLIQAVERERDGDSA